MAIFNTISRKISKNFKDIVAQTSQRYVNPSYEKPTIKDQVSPSIQES